MYDWNLNYVTKQLPIFTATLDNCQEFNEYLKETILEHRMNNPTTMKTNVNAWHSSYRTYRENPKFQSLIDLIESGCNDLSKSFLEAKTTTYRVYNLWAMMYDENDYTVEHHHFPATFSCCYYVDVDDNCSPIIVENDFELQPKNGLLALWLGSINHKVLPTNSKRMCISANILPTYTI